MSGDFTFSQVPLADIPRSVFNRSMNHKTTFDGGKLVPFFVDEVLPGDTFSVNATLFARMTTPIVPVMDNIWLDCFFFFVPNRLLWDKWVRMQGEQPNPGDSIDFTTPQLTSPTTGWAAQTMGDYFGLPQLGQLTAAITVSALPFRAYNKIFNAWFRDQNLEPVATEITGDGPDADGSYAIRPRMKRHDYFTSCLPWPAKSVQSQALIVPSSANASPIFWGWTGGTDGFSGLRTTAAANTVTLDEVAGNAVNLEWSDPALAVTVESLRQAFQIQRLLERDARSGTRYVEILRSHFGVVSPDFRLQRPEYLGGGTIPITINPVTQTSSTDATTPQGNLAGYGVGGGGVGFSKSFTEHGVLMGIISARADLAYQQGVHRMWSRLTRYDYYMPVFAHLGEQAVLRKEIYARGDSGDNVVFGYQERWAEYRYGHSKITGLMNSVNATPLDIWHLAQEFAPSAPVLNSAFIREDPPFDRVVAAPSQPHFLLDAHLNMKCVRPMPTYSVPGMIDHF